MIGLFETDLYPLLEILTSGVLIYIILIALSRMVGPRSFSQLTAFDFAVTVALGAIVGSTATGGVSFIRGVCGLALLFLIRWAVARLRSKGFTTVVDNSPIMIMDGSKILPEYLKPAKLTEEDLLQSLRKKGITQLQQVQAVVMERDGSISVLKTGAPLDSYLLKGVKGHPSANEEKEDPPLNEN